MRLEPPRRAPDNEQKLIVLCCLNRLGPCTELQLLQFLFEYDLMNYFEMMFALNDLCDRGQAARTKKGAGYLYAVTAAGVEALMLFGGAPQRVRPAGSNRRGMAAALPPGGPEPVRDPADGPGRIRTDPARC